MSESSWHASLSELKAARAHFDETRRQVSGSRSRLIAAQWSAVLTAHAAGVSPLLAQAAIRARDKSAASKARAVLEAARAGKTADGRAFDLGAFGSLGAAYAALVARNASAPTTIASAMATESDVLDWLAITVATADSPWREAERLRSIVGEALDAARDAAESVRGIGTPSTVAGP